MLEECIERLEAENRTKSRENEMLLGEIDRLMKENGEINAEMGQMQR